MDVFQSDEFRVPRIDAAVPTPDPEPEKKTYPYTTGLLAVLVALAGGLLAFRFAGTAGFGWAAAVWLLLFVVVLGRVITELANRPRG